MRTRSEVLRAAFRGGPGRYWLPLLVPGMLAVLSVPVSALGSPPLPAGLVAFGPQTHGTVASAMYLGGGSAAGPAPFPLGWDWTGALAVTVAAMIAWLRRCDRLPGTRTAVRGLGITGTVLTVAMAALPVLGWGVPVGSMSDRTWTWLSALWLQGTFALVSVCVLVAILAWMLRSSALAIITVACAAAAGLAGWLEARQAAIMPLQFYPVGDAAALLPGTVLTLAGLTAGAIASARARRRRAAGPGGAPGSTA
jgi:hypothetical protein